MNGYLIINFKLLILNIQNNLNGLIISSQNIILSQAYLKYMDGHFFSCK